MSNNVYTPNNATTASQPGHTGANVATTGRYSRNTHQGHAYQPPKTKTPVSAYGQSQDRPPSVSASRAQPTTSRGLPSPALAAGYPAQRASAAYNQPQHAAHPAQTQYNHTSQTSSTSARNAALSAAAHYNDYNKRQLHNPDATRSTVSSESSNYEDTQGSASTPQASSNNVAEPFNQGAITVDPSAVYDPWPEYQRKQEAMQAQKAAEDRKAEEARMEEERKEEERRRQEEEEITRQATASKSNQKARNPEPVSHGDASTEVAPTAESMEAEIRALMAKMREFNSKDPAMLARIWEEERRAKAPKSPTIATAPVPAPAPAQAVPANALRTANQRRKVSAAKEVPAAVLAKPATPIVTQHPPRPTAPHARKPKRASGNTIWPADKRMTLATAAANHLNKENPLSPMQPSQFLAMLDSNPSYIELCEQLESIGLKVDRAAFAKELLHAVPDVNGASRAKTTNGPSKGVVGESVPVAPPAVMRREIGTPATPVAPYSAAVPSPALAYPDSRDSHTPSAPTPAPVAEMISIHKPELKRPANKEEAARKRDFSDLIDLTQADDADDDLEPLPKRPRSTFNFTPTGYDASDHMDLDDTPLTSNFPIPARAAPQPVVHQTAAPPPPPPALLQAPLVEPIKPRSALRRNSYDIKTIARDVLLACGRHPEARQLNQHLEALRSTLGWSVQMDSDLSTLKWDIIDPGEPPQGYFKDSVQGLAEDADDEDDDEGDGDGRRAQGSLHSSTGTGHFRTQAPPPLAEAVNPFKRRGRPRSSFGPDQTTTPSTPKRSPSTMSASASAPLSDGVGYTAFKVTQYDANGNVVPKKRGRPVGWRKAIHGSSQTQAITVNPNQDDNTGSRPLEFKPTQPSTLRNGNPGSNEPIRIDSRSPSAPNQNRYYQSFKCRWEGCKAELHNLDTLKKHVNKVHRSAINKHGFIECHWADCASERPKPMAFTTIALWQSHLEHAHFSPLSWEMGDGPASGVSDATDSEAYLSDAHGRRVTPKLTPRPEYLERSRVNTPVDTSDPARPRGRGRPKDELDKEAREVQQRMVALKKRIGGPGMDRGGATLVNEKRRMGFLDNNDIDEELVDAED